MSHEVSRQPDHDFTLNSILPESKSSMDLEALGERMCRSKNAHEVDHRSIALSGTKFLLNGTSGITVL